MATVNTLFLINKIEQYSIQPPFFHLISLMKTTSCYWGFCTKRIICIDLINRINLKYSIKSKYSVRNWYRSNLSTIKAEYDRFNYHKNLKMNFKIFTTALLATGAVASHRGQENSLGEFSAKFQEMPEHIQRRFWVRTSFLLIKYSVFTYISAWSRKIRCPCRCQSLLGLI